MTAYHSLVVSLQKKNPKVYSWLIKRGVDLDNIHKNTATLATAATFLLTLPKGSYLPPLDEPIPEIIDITKDVSKKPRTDQERGQAVWAEYGQIIRESAAEHDVDPNLIFATIMIESGGNPRAVRYEPRLNDASYGLGQLLYSTARGLGYSGAPAGLYEPSVNIDLIARYHRGNLNRHGHLTPQELTTAYNTGSPHKKPLPGHLAKFNKWYNRVENLEVDLS